MTELSTEVDRALVNGNGAKSAMEATVSIPSGPVEARADAMAHSRKRGSYERFIKPVIDRTAGVLLALITIPVILVLMLAVLIKLKRPIFFRQARVGRNGKVFKIIKFRTMQPDRRSVSTPLGPEQDRRRTHKTDADPRLTPLGRFMRKWSLDELPQIWNVAMGQMSLVGPRPELVEIVNRYEAWQHRRHQVKPGVTGLWQISARGNGKLMHENTQIDLEYLDEVSMMTDLMILFKTLPAVTRIPEDATSTAANDAARQTALDHVARVRFGTYRSSKRILDILFAIVSLIVLSPVLILIALAIRLDSRGPALFLQVRVGYQGRLFRMLKFRTMHSDADESLHKRHYEQLAGTNGNGAAANSTPIRLDGDPRITRLGKFLRRWSLDELPNLFNILFGQMSLVGPRPFVPYEVDLHEDAQLARLEAKPGLTGLAQVRGRSDISMESRAALDLMYLEERSFLLDAKIAFKTVSAVLRRPGD